MGTPQTSVRTSHAVAIRVGGTTIGLIQSWAPTQSRGATAVYQLGADGTTGTGEVVEQVPGNVTGLTIAVNRVDLYNKKMEQAWGVGFSINMLTDQNKALEIIEKWVNPDTSVEVYQYEGCWFTQLGRTVSSTDDRIVKVNASLVYRKRTPVL